VFLEYWADADALRTHFAMPASIAFVSEAAILAVERPEMSIYEAHPVSI
jgi:quinol monooxygenase YgiN